MNPSIVYDLNNFLPQDWRGWDKFHTRLNRYEIFEGYYHNTPYHNVMAYAQSLKVNEGLYKHIRGVYNPVNRLVESYVSKLYGGSLDIREGKSGAIPLDTESDRLREVISNHLWVDSQWGQKKSLYVRYGAKTGDSFIKIVDNVHSRQVRMEVVDPAKVKELVLDADGSIAKVVFEYYIYDDKGSLKLYRETITPQRYEVQDADGKGIMMHRNGRNELIPAWDNEYGFVPLVHVQHIDVGLGFGAPVFNGILHKINELNDLASILNDGMRKQVNMPLVAVNTNVGRVDFGSDQSQSTGSTKDNPKKDTVSVLSISGTSEKPADLKTLPPTISIIDGLANIQEILKELERDLPELALHRLREGGNLTAPGVRSAYDDAISRYQEAIGVYDMGLVEAQKMAVAIGGMRGYDGYQGFNLMSLENDALDHQIQSRPIINDSLSMGDRQDLILRGIQANAPKTYYTKMNLSDDEAEEFAEAGQAQQNSFMMASPFETATATPPIDDPDATPEDAFQQRQNSGLNQNDLLNANSLLEAV